jgi:hypothetical protein
MDTLKSWSELALLFASMTLGKAGPLGIPLGVWIGVGLVILLVLAGH